MVSCFSKCELKTLNAPVQNRHKSTFVIQQVIFPDLLKMQSKCNHGNHQSAHQNSKIRTKPHQPTVLRSLHLSGKGMNKKVKIIACLRRQIGLPSYLS